MELFRHTSEIIKNVMKCSLFERKNNVKAMVAKIICAPDDQFGDPDNAHFFFQDISEAELALKNRNRRYIAYDIETNEHYILGMKNAPKQFSTTEVVKKVNQAKTVLEQEGKA